MIKLILGRMNPLHIGHKLEVMLPALKACNFDKVGPQVYFLTVLGTCNEDRDLQKNPFSFEQRRDMVLIATSELLQTNLRSAVSSENLEKISASSDGIAKVIDVEASFIAHYDSSKVNRPPSLDPLHERVVQHCKNHQIPIGQIHAFSSVKPGELGRAYQIEGKIYSDTSQLNAIADHNGFKCDQKFVDASADIISATSIREDLANNFISLSPRIFSYMQSQMASALLNKRPIGAKSEGDHFGLKDSQGFIEELWKEGRILAFGDGKEGVSIAEVPQSLKDTMEYYHQVSGLDRPSGQVSNAYQKTLQKAPEPENNI